MGFNGKPCLLIAVIILSSLTVLPVSAHIPTEAEGTKTVINTEKYTFTIVITPREPVPQKYSEIIVLPVDRISGTAYRGEGKAVLISVTQLGTNSTELRYAAEFEPGKYETAYYYPEVGDYLVTISLLDGDEKVSEVQTTITISQQTLNPFLIIIAIVIGAIVAVRIALAKRPHQRKQDEDTSLKM